eukprot:365009-Chlamydomonas_euryale.AAC.13
MEIVFLTRTNKRHVTSGCVPAKPMQPGTWQEPAGNLDPAGARGGAKGFDRRGAALSHAGVCVSWQRLEHRRGALSCAGCACAVNEGVA